MLAQLAVSDGGLGCWSRSYSTHPLGKPLQLRTVQLQWLADARP